MRISGHPIVFRSASVDLGGLSKPSILEPLIAR
jgi:hypothetical protein